MQTPLAGACLRPLGHLSGTRLIQGKAPEAQALSSDKALFPRMSSTQVHAERCGNKTAECRASRTQPVQDVLQRFTVMEQGRWQT